MAHLCGCDVGNGVHPEAMTTKGHIILFSRIARLYSLLRVISTGGMSLLTRRNKWVFGTSLVDDPVVADKLRLDPNVDVVSCSSVRDGVMTYTKNLHQELPIALKFNGQTKYFDSVEDLADVIHLVLLKKQQSMPLGFKCNCGKS